jgi:hypothetical protein
MVILINIGTLCSGIIGTGVKLMPLSLTYSISQTKKAMHNRKRTYR